MPWKVSSAMDERMRFVARHREATVTMTALCEEFGITRQCGYKWLGRYKAGGDAALATQSRAPRCHPNATPERVVDLVLETRRHHSTWGPRKILAFLRRQHPKLALPAASTVGTWLEQRGLTAKRHRRYHASGPGTTPFAEHVEANAGWSTDFKGHFRTLDGRYCYPLTMQDVHSRFLLRCQALDAPREQLAKPVYEAAFREYGLPLRMRSDNGTPFAAPSFTGLSPLSAWWISLGIAIERIVPGHPEQNGRLERMHRTLKEQTTSPPAANASAQQRRFRDFRREYNEDRPHEAIDDDVPASRFSASPRPFPRARPVPQYADGWDVRTVNARGTMTFKRRHLQIGTPLAGEGVGFEPVDDGVWAIHYFGHRLGEFDLREGTLTCAGGTRNCASGQ